MCVINNNEYLSNLTGFNVTEPLEFLESKDSDLDSFLNEENGDLTYFEYDNEIYFKAEDIHGVFIIFKLSDFNSKF